MGTKPADTMLDLRPVMGVLLSVVVLLVVTLAPFDFQRPGDLDTPSAYLIRFLSGRSHLDDALNNLLLFLPAGFLLAMGLRARVRGLGASLGLVLAAAGALSLGIELLQLFLPSREAAPLDVLANMGGAGLGALSLALADRWARSARSLLGGLAVYLTIAVFVAMALQPTVNLTSWDPSYQLLVGNEANGRRPWRGSVAELRAADLALTPEAARELLAGGSVPSFEANRVFDYRLAGPEGLVDQAGRSPRLMWRKGRPLAQPGGGVGLDGEHWLLSDGPMGRTTEAIRARSAFTLVATVTSASPEQSGPARIISLSYNNSLRNLTLGQNGADLVVRLRTGSNGPNGRYQQLVVPKLLSNDRPMRLVLTYSGARLALYVEGGRAFVLTLDPEISLLRHLLAGSLRALLEQLPHWLVNWGGYGLYYLALFVPLGLTLACWAYLRGSPRSRALAALGAASLPVLLELALSWAGARAPRPLAAIGGAALATAALLWFHMRSRTWSSPTASGTGG